MNAKRIVQRANSATEALTEHVLLRLLGRVSAMIALPAVSWAILLLLDLDKRDAMRMQDVSHLNSKVSGLQQEIIEKTQDRYTNSAAEYDWLVQRGRDERQDANIQRIEGRVDRIENFYR